ncbi:MAG: RNA polymerase sigma factor [Myxococcales bacterium]|nr:RNA polymerase sigma factor [Myxococcales bacterium]
MQPALCQPAELVAAIQRGDRAVLDRLSRCYGAHLLAVGRRWCRDGDEAQDAVQDAMLAAGEHLGDFRGEGSVEGWLVRMVVRACQRMRRGQKNDARLHAPFEELEIPAARETPADEVARGEEMAALGAALLTLAPLDRTLVLLADGEGWTAPELAERVDMSAGAVRTRLSRARRALRAAMAEALPEKMRDA